MKNLISIFVVFMLLAGTAMASVEQYCYTIDFEDLTEGEVVTDQVMGIDISVVNNAASHPDKAIVFDSAEPTGGDLDLGTPNEDFGGPGIGEGGEQGAPGENNAYLNHVLIIAEDDVDENGDGYVDDPDDEGHGGTITIEFHELADVVNIKVLDIESDESFRIDTFDVDDQLIDTTYGQSLGDNSYQLVPINDDLVQKMDIVLSSSGAVDELYFCTENEIPEFGFFGVLAATAIALMLVFMMRRKK